MRRRRSSSRRSPKYCDPDTSLRAPICSNAWVRRDAECEALAELLLNGETRFFRYPAAFESLTKIVLPGLEARKSAGKSPQSSHPERRLLHRRGTVQHRHVGMRGSELQRWLERAYCGQRHSPARPSRSAERGLYPLAAFEQVPHHLVQAYFVKVGDHLLTKPRLRNLVRFSHMNLAKPAFLGQFDSIFCMDVLPHFSTAQRMTLVQRLHCTCSPADTYFWARMKNCRPRK